MVLTLVTQLAVLAVVAAQVVVAKGTLNPMLHIVIKK
jgi:hypothetical protein